MLFAILLDLNTKLTEENTQLQQDVKNLENLVSCYAEQIRLVKVKRFGRKAEAGGQLEFDFSQIFDEDETPIAEDPVDVEETLANIENITYTRKKKTVGRKLDTSKLPREVVVHDLSEAEKCCSKCGNR